MFKTPIAFATTLAALAGLLFTAAPATAVTAPTYADFTMMFKPGGSSGDYYTGSGTTAATNTAYGGAWRWAAQSATVSDISWSPGQSERHALTADRKWSTVQGYGSGLGTPLTWRETVTCTDWSCHEAYSDNINCTGFAPLAPAADGSQHYALYTTPSHGYCLDSWGEILGPPGTPVVHFRHWQQWGSPVACSNPFRAGLTCIAQHELWYDDNGAPWGQRIDRTVWLAKGLGMLFKDVDNSPGLARTWTAYGRDYPAMSAPTPKIAVAKIATSATRRAPVGPSLNY